ncbi:hypothetical protein ACFTWN_08545 [Streptomyces sp. NPDC057092]|uniref:hypothetical protein n=1 Tax=Streptomyces sp. NPDC057092 TaxID=3346017 RepID=UPI00363E8698
MAWRKLHWARTARPAVVISRFSFAYFLAACVAHGVITKISSDRRKSNDEPLAVSRLGDAWASTVSGGSIEFALTTLFLILLVIGALAAFADLGKSLFVVTTALRRSYTRRRILTQYQLVGSLLVGVIYAARVQHLPRDRKAHGVRDLSNHLKSVYRDLGRLVISHGSVPIRSHRKSVLKEHHARVVAAIQKVEAKVDVDVVGGSRELAEILLHVANRYADGKVGELLPAEVLDDVHPVRNWEPVKMIATAVLLGGLTVAAVLMKIPEAALTPVVGVAGILAVSLVYGRNARSGLDILDSVRGIQRP